MSATATAQRKASDLGVSSYGGAIGSFFGGSYRNIRYHLFHTARPGLRTGFNCLHIDYIHTLFACMFVNIYLCNLHWIIYIHCLHVCLPNLHSIKSLKLFYRVMLLSLYTLNT